MLSVDRLARAYGVTLIDYEREGGGLLISSGSGSMLSVMDVCPVFRWCFDIDGIGPRGRLDWIEAAGTLVDLIGGVGWFSITDPEPLRRALHALVEPPYVYVPDVNLPGRCHASLDAFIESVNQHAARSNTRCGT